MLESETTHKARSTSLYRRLVSVAIVALSVTVSALIFGGINFSTNLLPNPDLTKLEVVQHVEGAVADSVISMPHTWQAENPTEGAPQTRHYRIELPVTAVFADHEIYISAFRQTIEIHFQGRLLAKAGNKKINWLEPFPQPLRIPLTTFEGFASDKQAMVFDLSVTASVSGSGGLAGVWYGPTDSIGQAQSFFVRFMPTLLLANIGVLTVLIFFLSVDSVLSSESRHRLLLTVPHLMYSLLCLPEIEFLSSLTWLKLYQISINSIVLIWMYIGFYSVGILNRWLAIPIGTILAVSLPYLFFGDFESTCLWVYKIQNPLMGGLGLVVFVYFGWRLPDSENKALHCIFLVAGSLLCGAGINDIPLNLAGNADFRLLVLPVAALFNSLVLVAWATLEMFQRNQQLISQQQRLQKLFATRTHDLEEARSELMQHQRYQVLNTMGSAISHEIKNPLAALNNDLTLLKLNLGNSQSDIPLPIERMQRTLLRIDNTVSDLSDFSRRQSIDKQTIELSKWLNELIADTEITEMLDKSIVHMDIEVDLKANFDPELMRRAIVNVIENSTLAIANQLRGELRLEAYSTDSHVVISLSDNGPGLNADDIDKLWEPLVSGRNLGLGLGLPIVRDIVHLHFGSVKLDNKHTEDGAIVTFTLPKS